MAPQVIPIPARTPVAMASRPKALRRYYVYLLRCGDRSYYTGYTTDPGRRLAAHRAGRGARYTRGRGPLRLVGVWRCPTRSAALRLELRLKRLPRPIKARLAEGRAPDGLGGLLGRAAAARVRYRGG
jgi:putative endonuclease